MRRPLTYRKETPRPAASHKPPFETVPVDRGSWARPREHHAKSRALLRQARCFAPVFPSPARNHRDAARRKTRRVKLGWAGLGLPYPANMLPAHPRWRKRYPISGSRAETGCDGMGRHRHGEGPRKRRRRNRAPAHSILHCVPALALRRVTSTEIRSSCRSCRRRRRPFA